MVARDRVADRDVARRVVALQRLRAAAAAADHLVEQRLGRAASDHAISDPICVLLVAVTGAADATGELDAAALLHHVRCLVGRGVEIRRAAERDAVAGRIGRRSDRGGRLGRDTADRGLHATDVVTPERLLDHRRVRQRTRGIAYACGGRRVDRLAARGAAGLALDRGRTARRRRLQRFEPLPLIELQRAIDHGVAHRLARERGLDALERAVVALDPGQPAVLERLRTRRRIAGCGLEHLVVRRCRHARRGEARKPGVRADERLLARHR